MGLDLWFRQDVARILAATWETMQATSHGPGLAARPRGGVAMAEGVETADERITHAYRRGFEDALRSVSIAFGLAEGNGNRETSLEREFVEWPESKLTVRSFWKGIFRNLINMFLSRSMPVTSVDSAQPDGRSDAESVPLFPSALGVIVSTRFWSFHDAQWLEV